MDLGEHVKRMRLQLGLTLEELANSAGTDTGNLSRFENGKAGYSAGKLQQIAQALGVPLSVLYVDSEAEQITVDALTKEGWQVTFPSAREVRGDPFSPDMYLDIGDRRYNIEVTDLRRQAAIHASRWTEKERWFSRPEVLIVEAPNTLQSVTELIEAIHAGGDALARRKDVQLFRLGQIRGHKEFMERNPHIYEPSREPAPVTGLVPILSWEHEDDLPPGEYVQIPRLEIHLSAGHGSEQIEIEFVKQQPQAFRTEWIRKKRLKPGKLACMYASGDSMEDRIFDGDSLVIDTGDTTVVDGRVYALWYDGGERVKRLYRRPGGGLLIRSDNSSKHPEILLNGDEANFVRVIGRVVQVSGDQGL